MHVTHDTAPSSEATWGISETGGHLQREFGPNNWKISKKYVSDMHVTHELKVQFGSEKVDIETFNSNVHYLCKFQGVGSPLKITSP